ncbi:MAG: hypothetical protein D6737_02770 [Chloroflexi bacterium]|nr:MAG: hypothetical protein D6737_02770 [Chloroflexota bacterium]
MRYTPLQLAEAFITTGELDDALTAINEHLDETPDDDDARRMRVGILLRLADATHWQMALADIACLTTLTPDDYVLWMRILDAQGDDGALEVARQMYVAHPNDERAAEIFVERLVAAAAYSEAETVLNAMPEDWRWLQRRGDLAALQDRHDDAVTYYSRALVLLETAFAQTTVGFAANFKANLLIKRAHANRHLGQLDEAEADYAAAEKLLPGDVMIAFNRGLLAALRGDLPHATELCRDAFNRANDTLRAMMRDELDDDARFETLANALV